MTYSYLNIQKQKNKQILNYIKHEKSTITSKRDTHSSYWTGDVHATASDALLGDGQVFFSAT